MADPNPFRDYRMNVTNTMTVERRLYFRMLNAVFGHYNGLKWNIMEECEYATSDRTAQMEYLKAVDPYNHPVTYQPPSRSRPGKDRDETCLIVTG